MLKYEDKFSNFLIIKVIIVKNDSAFAVKFKEELAKQMEKYLPKYSSLEAEFLQTSTVLDPKYKKLSFLEDKKEIKKYYSSAVDSIKSLDFENEDESVFKYLKSH